MNIHPMRSKRDHEAALERIEALFGAEPNTPQGDELVVLATLVEAYEDQHYAIPAADPVEAVNYVMESPGLSRKDLEPYVGNRARVSEVLNRRRPLTLRMIQRLHLDLGISADALVQPYRLPSTKPARKTALTSARSSSLRVRGGG